MKTLLIYTSVIFAALLFTSCGGGKSGGGGTESRTPLPSLSASEYSKLSPEEQYYVASKLMDTMQKGVPASEFFDLQRQSFDLTTKYSDYLSWVRETLKKPLDHTKKDYYFKLVEDKYNFDSSYKPPQYIMALLWEVPLSKDYYDMWMAYFLANTILFSPATELETVSYLDIEKVYSRLVRMIANDEPIGNIVYQHMISQENWRRFRSPEDNTREMMEIYLRWFKDEDVPRAAKACKNWYLTDQAQGYQLVITFDENTEPQNAIGTTITTCWDFYKAIANHSRLIPTAVAVIVDHLFSTYTDQQKQSIVDAIMAAKPKTFRDIFNIILFSREYLLNAERPKKWEESFYGTAKRIKYKPGTNFFRYINRPNGYTGATVRLRDVKQPPLIEKLGRTPVPPLDALSFAYYHKSVRENMMINISYNADDDGWGQDFYDVTFTGDDFIHYVFVSALGRKATQQELDTLNQIFNTKNWQDRHRRQKTRIILDYISRLPEFYMFKKVN